MSDVSGETALAAFRSRLEEFAADNLRDYVARIQRNRPAVSSKEINDPVWGTLYVRGIEVLFLDSPMIQRLRTIRQLGVAHLVYPGAVHTRFEHSLGVVSQVNRIAEAIARRQGDAPAAEETAQLESWHIAVLRLAALSHDIGHGVMSHVSENALEHNTLCEQVQLAFADERGVAGSWQLGEIAAYYMIRSEQYRKLLVLQP